MLMESVEPFVAMVEPAGGKPQIDRAGIIAHGGGCEAILARTGIALLLPRGHPAGGRRRSHGHRPARHHPRLAGRPRDGVRRRADADRRPRRWKAHRHEHRACRQMQITYLCMASAEAAL